MDVESALREIDEANHKHLGAGEEYERLREEYAVALERIDDLAGPEAVEDLARYIDEHIRAEEERPSVGQVDKRGAEILRDRGVDTPVDSRFELA